MTGPHTLVFNALAAVMVAGLAGCDGALQPAAPPAETAATAENGTAPVTLTETPAPLLPVHPEASIAAASIDWEAARRDLAANPVDSGDGSFRVESGDAAPPVPVFLPPQDVSIASGEAAMRFQATSDGYFAAMPGEKFDVVVNGTNQVIGPADGVAAARGETYTYLGTVTGAQVSFSRYGADYLVEFECKDLPGGQADCITEAEALAFTRDLGLSGTR